MRILKNTSANMSNLYIVYEPILTDTLTVNNLKKAFQMNKKHFKMVKSNGKNISYQHHKLQRMQNYKTSAHLIPMNIHR